MGSSRCNPTRSKRACRPVTVVAIYRATGGWREAYTARKQVVKIQLRNSVRGDADAVNGGRQHPDDRYSKVAPGSPEALAQGMLPNGYPINPRELTISARRSGNVGAKGNCEGSRV
jgi:hypothetical protein